jgi:hypothetical protein
MSMDGQIICDQSNCIFLRRVEKYWGRMKGMSAEQVLCCIIAKILFGFTYEELAFHIVDSQSLRRFSRIGMAEEGFKKSALNRSIKVISDQTREMINRDILGYARSTVKMIKNTVAVELRCSVGRYRALRSAYRASHQPDPSKGCGGLKSCGRRQGGIDL